MTGNAEKDKNNTLTTYIGEVVEFQRTEHYDLM